MKILQCTLALAATLAFSTAAQASFIVEATGGLASATNFGFGNNTAGASNSIPSTAVGLTSSNSIFGGSDTVPPPNPLADSYIFSYTPGPDVDNFSPSAGTVLGSSDGSPGLGLTSSGQLGGGSGTYNVYFTAPASTNVSGGLTNFTASGDNGGFGASHDINSLGTGADTQVNPQPAGIVGGANNAWLLIGTVDLTSGTTYSVELNPSANTFVSMRAHAVMWELVAPVPEPSTFALAGLAMLGLGLVARRR